MFRSYKYRIYPTKEQAQKIDATIGVCRLVYNLALEVKIRAYKEHGVNLYAFDLCRQLNELKAAYPWIAEVDSQAVQASVKKVDIAFKRFSQGNGYPKFKKKRNGGTFLCPNNRRRIDWDKNTLSIPKIKNIPIRISRRFEGEIKTVAISKTSTGKYFAGITVEQPGDDPIPPNKSVAIGIDLGIKDFATLSTGEKIPNQKFSARTMGRIKYLQRKNRRKKRGSKNQKKANLRIAKLYERSANQRNDFLHKLSHRLISDNQTDTICIETLSILNLVKNRKLSSAISDTSWGEFVRQLEYKARWSGKNIVKIDRFFASSKICSSCGHKHESMTLDDREWVCENCGECHDRDVNAAINIRNSGMGNSVELVEVPSIDGPMKQELQ